MVEATRCNEEAVGNEKRGLDGPEPAVNNKQNDFFLHEKCERRKERKKGDIQTERQKERKTNEKKVSEKERERNMCVSDGVKLILGATTADKGTMVAVSSSKEMATPRGLQQF